MVDFYGFKCGCINIYIYTSPMDPMGDTSLDTFTYYPNNQDLFFHSHGGNKIDPSNG